MYGAQQQKQKQLDEEVQPSQQHHQQEQQDSSSGSSSRIAEATEDSARSLDPLRHMQQYKAFIQALAQPQHLQQPAVPVGQRLAPLRPADTPPVADSGNSNSSCSRDMSGCASMSICYVTLLWQSVLACSTMRRCCFRYPQSALCLSNPFQSRPLLHSAAAAAAAAARSLLLRDAANEDRILERAFAFFDRDGNGEIDVAELR
jgi:hypothetical protein